LRLLPDFLGYLAALAELNDGQVQDALEQLTAGTSDPLAGGR